MNNIIEIRQIDRGAIDYLVRNLENFESDRAIKSGLKAAGNIFASGGKNRLRQRMKCGSRGFTGNLLGSFQVRVKKSRPGVLAGFRQGKGGGSHSYLIDRGTNERFWDKNGKSTGRVTGNSFWSDTEAQDNPKAINKLYEGIERAVNRINNRQ
jgi:hypothetical protein